MSRSRQQPTLLFLPLLGSFGLLATLASVAQVPTQPKPKLAHASFTETLTGEVEGKPVKVTFDMVAIPAGTFRMGSPVGEPDRRLDEGPQVPVAIKPFWMGKCEVTWDEFDLYFMPSDALKRFWDGKKPPEGTADAVSKPTKPYVDETYSYERNKHPVISITHHTAMKYCEWLAKTTGKPYRLPTEAEWEYACRAGSTTPHAIPKDQPLGEYAWYTANATTAEHPRGTTHAVGTRKANAWGIHDMHGNVMEWCLDHYVEDAYTRFNSLAVGGIVPRPMMRPTENKWAHVARGGHFKADAKDLRSAVRVASHKEWLRLDPQEPQSIWWLTMMDNVGFRVCLSLDDAPLKGITSTVSAENDGTFKPK